jgi:hypothetical protein
MGQVPGRLQKPWRQALVLGPLAPTTVDRCHVRWPGAESEQQLAGHLAGSKWRRNPTQHGSPCRCKVSISMPTQVPFICAWTRKYSAQGALIYIFTRCAPPVCQCCYYIHRIGLAASASPFSEPTSPNPTLTKYAEATERLHNYGSYLMQCLPKFIQQFSVLKDELTLYIAPSAVVPVLTFLRDHSQCQFKSVMDISGVDFPERDKRFEVVYHLLSIQYAARIRVKTYTGEADAVPSATPLFSGANW